MKWLLQYLQSDIQMLQQASFAVAGVKRPMRNTDLPRRLLWLLAIGFLILSGCNPSKAVNGPRIRSVAQLHTIGVAIRDYKDDNLTFPNRLSDLVPTQIAFSRIEVFYVTNEFTQQQIQPVGWNTNAALIDQFSSYSYLGTNGSNGIIAHERTNLWRPTATYPDQVAVLFEDFHVEYVSIITLRSWLRTK